MTRRRCQRWVHTNRGEFRDRGVPESKRDEYRVGMLPVSVEELTRAGHKVIVQDGAGIGSGLADQVYQKRARNWSRGIRGISASDLDREGQGAAADELSLIRQGQIVFTYFHLAADRELTEGLLAKAHGRGL